MTESKHVRILAISLSTGGVGFAVMEAENVLVAWGNKVVKGENKNARCLAKVKELIGHYEPQILVLESASIPGSRRSRRIRDLAQRVVNQSKRSKVHVVSLSRAAMRQGFLSGNHGTKQAIAEILAKRFPQQLAHFLPSKRRAWETENYRMAMVTKRFGACREGLSWATIGRKMASRCTYRTLCNTQQRYSPLGRGNASRSVSWSNECLGCI